MDGKPPLHLSVDIYAIGALSFCNYIEDAPLAFARAQYLAKGLGNELYPLNGILQRNCAAGLQAIALQGRFHLVIRQEPVSSRTS